MATKPMMKKMPKMPMGKAGGSAGLRKPPKGKAGGKQTERLTVYEDGSKEPESVTQKKKSWTPWGPGKAGKEIKWPKGGGRPSGKAGGKPAKKSR